MKNKVYRVVTTSRGFLTALYNCMNKESKEVSFLFKEDTVYEKPSFIHKYLSKIIRYRIFSLLGIFQIINLTKREDNIYGYFSYNRFLKSKLPYIIYLENPYALVNYSLDRMEYYISKKRLEKCFNDPQLKSIVCLSQACKNTIKKIYDIPSKVKICQIYPLIETGYLTKEYHGKIYCLFIASEFYVKGGLEILEAFEKMEYSLREIIELTVITPLNDLDASIIQRLNKVSVCLKDFNLTKEEMKKEYSTCHIILNPTRMDSFSLVTLESMKYGCVYIGTNIYAIAEMIEEGVNGYCINSNYSIWKSNNLMDPYKNAHRGQTIYSTNVDIEVVDFIINKINYLNENRNMLESLSRNAYNRSNNKDFSYYNILRKWEELL